MVTLELCTNREAIRDWCGLDFSAVAECDQNEAADTFVRDLDRALSDAGYDTVNAKGQRSVCHGWNGANTFAWKRGPVGTFEDLTAEQEEEIESIINRVEVATVETWKEEHAD